MIDELGDDGAALGLIRGTMAIGALAGSILIARLARHLHPSILYSAGLIGMGVVSTMFWNAPTVTTALAIYIVLFTLSGVPGSALTVGLFTTIHPRSPSHTIGRVVGLMGTAEALGSASGAIIAGILVDRVPLRPLLNAQAAIYITTGLLAGALIARNRAEHSPESAATPTAFSPAARTTQ